MFCQFPKIEMPNTIRVDVVVEISCPEMTATCIAPVDVVDPQ